MLILPDSCRHDRAIPQWFIAGLRDMDPELTCYWNPHRERFVIDRRQPDGSSVNVRVVEDGRGEYRPLGEDLLAELKASDLWSKHGTVENYQRSVRNAEAEDEARREQAINNVWDAVTKDNRRQLHKAFDLLQTHDFSTPPR